MSDRLTVEAPTDAQEPQLANGRYDARARRQSKRSGRETGCWAYIPAEELTKAGIDPGGPPPFYRVWGTQRGGAFVRLYRQR